MAEVVVARGVSGDFLVAHAHANAYRPSSTSYAALRRQLARGPTLELNCVEGSEFFIPVRMMLR